MKAIYH